MLDLNRVEYRVTCIAPDNRQLDITNVTAGLGWSEGQKELSAKIQLKVAADATLEDGKPVANLLKPFVTIVIFADVGEGFVECCRGKIQKVSVAETNHDFYLSFEIADEAGDLRKSQDSFYFTADHTSSAILQEILGKWGVPAEINVTDIKHSKKVYRGKYLSDMVADILKDIKEAGGGEYFVRATGGKVEIVKRGQNSTVYHFDTMTNVTKVSESLDASKTVTSVQVVGKSKDEGHPPVEQTVNGRTDTGTRKVIYNRPSTETPAEAEKAAKKILDEQGEPKRKLSIETPDIPTVRKGDKIRLRSATGTGFFLINSIRHDAVSRKMTLELAEDKAANKTLGQNFSTSSSDGTETSDPA